MCSACYRGPNPSIERTCPGKPGHVLSSQTLGPLTSNEAAALKTFLVSLLASRSPSGTFFGSLWASRWPLLQWIAVLVVFAALFGYTFGAAYVPNVVAAGVGLVLGLVVSARQGHRTWPWLSSVIDWGKVESDVTRAPEDRA